MRKALPFAGVLMVLAMLAAACGSDRSAADDGPVPAERLASATEGLCDAEALAAAGDVDAAADAFHDRAHQFLHDMALVVEERDRAASARLLEAKNRVETALRDGARGEEEPAQVVAALQALTGEVRDAARVLGMEAPDCER